MKKILTLLFLMVAFANAEVVTKTTTKRAAGEGYGATYEEALSKALSDAVGRMNGVKLSSKTFYNTISTQNGKKRNLQKTFDDVIYKKTRGRFDSYDVVRKTKTSTGYNVKVLIKKSRTIKKYKTPGISPNNRRRIAVISSYSSKMVFSMFGQRYYNRNVTHPLTQEVVSAITQTRKFTVLDRQANEAYEEEKFLIQNNGAKDELLKLGQVLGTDYLYVLNVESFNIQKTEDINELMGTSTQNAKANATIQYRIIAMATRQIKYSNTKSFSFTVEGDNKDQYLHNAFAKIAKSLTDDIINNIYPLKIAGTSGNEVIFSQKLNLGDKYNVYALGKKIYDSYTKESVGYDEQKVGTIEVTRVNPKISYAKIIQGSAKKGNLCRLISSSLNGTEASRSDVTEEEKPSDVQVIEGGGVLLPID